MTTYGIFEAKAKLSQICETVARTSEPVVISKRGKPLVKIVPIETESGKRSVWDTLEESRHRYGPIGVDLEIPERAIAREWNSGTLDDE